MNWPVKENVSGTCVVGKRTSREVKGWHIQGETAQEFYRVTTIYLRSKYSYKDYLWPLKLETILKDPNLVQNPGW